MNWFFLLMSGALICAALSVCTIKEEDDRPILATRSFRFLAVYAIYVIYSVLAIWQPDEFGIEFWNLESMLLVILLTFGFISALISMVIYIWARPHDKSEQKEWVEILKQANDYRS